MPKVGLVWAQNTDRAIGVDGGIPWHLPEDLKHFSEVTLNSTVIMGKATWFSLPEKFRPLPKRKNLVLSSNPDFIADGADTFTSIEDAIDSVETEWAWIIGGQRLYETSMVFADKLEITQVDLPDVEADTFAPIVPPSFQDMTVRPDEHNWFTSTNGTRYRFETHIR